MKKLYIFVFLLLIAIILMLYFYFNINKIIFQSVDNSEVTNINIKIEKLYENTIFLTLVDPMSIHKIIEIEDLVRENDGTNFLIKAKPWYIEIEYNLKNRETIIRKYKGQRIIPELQNEFSKIPEIQKIIIVK